jgi:phage terminase large subunit-like protein
MTSAASSAQINITDALRSRHLFGPFFSGASWNRWKAVLKAVFAEPLSALELDAFREVAGREPPSHCVKEFVAVVGRGSGKDSVASFIAAFIAISFDPRIAELRPGELAFVLLVAVDKDQAAIAYRYVRAFFEEVPALKKLVKSFGSDTIELNNEVVVQVTTNSYRSIRGRSVLAAIFDEVSFWRSDESANPDIEVHAAIGPGLAHIKGSMLILISSAHRRAGLIYERWKSCYGQADDDTLVVRGTTRQF